MNCAYVKPLGVTSMVYSEADLAIMTRKLRFKVRFHLGAFCPDTEDVVQETLARFVHAASAGAIANLERYGAFLNGVCNNVIREWRRQAWREPPYDAEIHGEPAVKGEGERLLVRDEVQDALSHLLPRDADILRGFFLEQRSKDEICREHQLTDAQFRVILFRAKQRFRTVYDTNVKQSGTQEH